MLEDRFCAACKERKPLDTFREGARRCLACDARVGGGTCFHCHVWKPRDAFEIGPRKRRTVCKACTEKVEAAERARREAAERARLEITFTGPDGTVMRRCSECRIAKPLAEAFYSNGKKKNGERQYAYKCKACDIERVRQQRLREQADPELLRQRREQFREYGKAYRERHPDRSREAQREYQERRALRETTEERRARLEDRRLQERLKRVAAGKAVRDGSGALESPGGLPRLPAVPLRRAIDQWAERKAFDVTRACQALDLSERVYRFWGNGRDTVLLDLADRMIQSLGLLWWDVWRCEHHALEEGCAECEGARVAEIVFEGDWKTLPPEFMGRRPRG